MAGVRKERLEELLKREISDIILREVKDPRIGFVTVTDAEVTRDLCFAKVFVSIMGDAAERASTLEALAHAAGFVRHELGPRLGLREVPEIRFVHDESLDRGARVEELLKRIHDGQPPEDEGAE